MSEKLHEIRDPIHGLIPFNDLEREIINSPEFQRLRRIRQLAWTDYVYPGAMHTRFEHSIGVMHIAGRVFDALRRDFRSKNIAESEYGLKGDEWERQRQLVRLAALGHDLGHGPFSHAAEELFPVIEQSNSSRKRIPHEEYSAAIIKNDIAQIIKSHRTGNELGLDAAAVASFIDGVPADGKVALLKDVISGTIDADRMDYLLRDAYHCGVRYGQFDLERIINTIGICEDHEEGNFQIGINRDGVHAAEGLVIARFMMFTQVYMHKTRTVYDFHFEHCMKELLKEEGGTFPGPRSVEELSRFKQWDDWRVLGCLSRGEGGSHGRRIRDRDHYRLVYETEEVFEGDGDQERANRKFERAKTATDSLGSVKLVASKSWYSQKVSSDILVRDQDGDNARARPLSQVSNVVKSLKPVNQLRLYVPRENVDSAEKMIAQNLRGGGKRVQE